MTQETELKLELDFEDARRLEASALFTGKPKKVKQRALYFDTPDRLISGAGLSLRIRSAGGKRVQTVKADGARAVGLFVRSEWERPVECDQPILDDTTPIRTFLGDKVRKIGPVFAVEIDRWVWIVRNGEAEIEVSLDRGHVSAGDRRVDVCEVELELKTGPPSVLFSLARSIDELAPVRLGVLSKSERGNRLIDAVARSFKAEPVLLERTVSVEAAFQQIAGACLRQFRLNEPLIDSANPAALHQARVGLRRLRSALSIFKPVLDDEDYPLLRDSLRWLSGELGKVRDLDVLVTRAQAQPFREQLEAARLKAYAELAATLSSERTRSLMINLVEWIAIGRWSTRFETQLDRKREAIDFGRRILAKQRKHLKNAGKLDELDDEGRHEARKIAKKLRYASEFFSSLFSGKKERRRHARFIETLERLQTVLGALNDVATGPAVLASLGMEYDPNADDARKAKLLSRASEAHDDLLNAKRFWI